jgi:hypothetical protein
MASAVASAGPQTLILQSRAHGAPMRGRKHVAHSLGRELRQKDTGPRLLRAAPLRLSPGPAYPPGDTSRLRLWAMGAGVVPRQGPFYRALEHTAAGKKNSRGRASRTVAPHFSRILFFPPASQHATHLVNSVGRGWKSVRIEQSPHLGQDGSRAGVGALVRGGEGEPWSKKKKKVWKAALRDQSTQNPLFFIDTDDHSWSSCSIKRERTRTSYY